MNELVSEVRDMLWDQLKTVLNISYILKDQTGHLKLMAYDPHDEENIIGASGRLESGFITYEIPDWDFNVDSYLLEDLEQGYEIVFMPITEHYNVWCAIAYAPEDIEHAIGLQEYLKYCQRNNITAASLASLGLQQLDISHLYKETNEGYRIMADYTVNKVAYVIGYNPQAPEHYAVCQLV